MGRKKSVINNINNSEEIEMEKGGEKEKKKSKNISKEVKKDDINLNEGINIIDNKEENITFSDLIETTKEKVKKSAKSGQGYAFFKAFFTKLKEEKLYLLSFIITVSFILFFSLSTLKDTQGYYDRLEESINSANMNKEEEKNVETPVLSEDVDVSSYIGFYGREVSLNNPVKINGTCEITDYKLVYEIKKDRTLIKYLVNDCLGTKEIWADKLAYVSSGGVRHISANGINFLFSANSIKEVNAETYKLDDSISSLKENLVDKNSTIDFYNSNIVIRTNNDLLLIKGNNVAYQLSQSYNINSNVSKSVYDTNSEGIYKFIAYDNIEYKKCYNEISDDIEIDAVLYKIYSIKFNQDNEGFNKAKELVVRKISDGCNVFDDDLSNLEE